MPRTEVRQDTGRARALRVGALLVVGLLVLAVAIYQVGRVFDVFASRYPLYTQVETVAGLREGAAITLAGQRVGQVDEIRFIPLEQVEGDNHLVVRLSVNEEVRSQIRADSRAYIRSQGLLGDRYIDIEPGTAAAPVLDAGDVIPSAEVADLETVLGQASETMATAQGAIEDLRSITSSLERGEGTLGRLLVDDDLYLRMTNATGQLAVLLDDMNEGRGSLGQLVQDPTLYRRAVSAAARVDSLTRVMLYADGTFGRLLRDDALYDRTLDAVSGLDTTLARLDRFVAGMEEGEGTLQRLIADPRMYDELLKAVVDLQTLIADIRADPQRFVPPINVDVF